MPGPKVTLQNRITSLLIASAVLFIGVFTFIQINNQVTRMVHYNSYRANSSTLISKNNLEAVIRQTEGADAVGYLQASLDELKNAQLINEAEVYDREGKIVAASDQRMVGEYARYRDLSRIETLREAQDQDTPFLSEMDKRKKELNTYLALKRTSGDQAVYFVKLSYSLGSLHQALIEVYKPVTITAVLIILLNILFGFLLSKTIVGPIKTLNEVTKIIAEGDLSIRTEIRTDDELEELGETFNHMTEQLVKMKEKAENANPLTKLPGNLVIAEEVEKRIRANKQFTVIYCDLDNFKAFNDKYGIASGDEAIKLTAQIFKEAVEKRGSPEDFIGHEGGDDFLLLTEVDKAQEIADYITQEFNKRVRPFYSQEDLDRGFIIAKSRDNVEKQFPIMTISLAGVTNQHRKINSYAEVTNIAAEVKKKAKAIGGSTFVMDKRTS
ncbi:MAG: diguanylate cyclase [Candidatus Omnitrophica bacterium]|nr:diguanylate cyclase [Candidatus Omnitrophota bacterium]